MRDEDRERFALALNIMAEMYRAEISSAAAQIWWECVEDLEVGQFEAAVKQAVKACRFMPTPADVREAAGESSEQKAGRQWALVLRAISRAGSYRAAHFADPVTVEAIRQYGGWVGICTSSESDEWKRKKFLKLYQANDVQSVRETPPAVLPGHHGFGQVMGFGFERGELPERVEVNGQLTDGEILEKLEEGSK